MSVNYMKKQKYMNVMNEKLAKSTRFRWFKNTYNIAFSCLWPILDQFQRKKI